MPCKYKTRLVMSPVKEEECRELTDFFTRNGLKLADAEEKKTNIVRSYKITKGDAMIAAASLAQREGQFYVDAIAVDPSMRKGGVGKILLNKLVSAAKDRGGKQLWLAAPSPGFFLACGFRPADAEETEASCLSEYAAEQRDDESGHPEIMKKEIA